MVLRGLFWREIGVIALGWLLFSILNGFIISAQLSYYFSKTETFIIIVPFQHFFITYDWVDKGG